MRELVVNDAPPSGTPLGTNSYFRFGAAILIPLLNLVTKRDWRGAQNIPTTGPVIVVGNHISYADAFLFAHFLYKNGRAPRYIGKASVFRIPIFGKIILGAGQIPVERETDSARNALIHAESALRNGHCLGIYPEGTLTRDESSWPMRAKTGVARLAIATQVPVIPCAQWGAQEFWPPYTKVPRLWRRTKISVWAGEPLDFSRWKGLEEDPVALDEATKYVMDALTRNLEKIRGESAPAEIFDPHTSDLPRTGNFKKKRKRTIQ